MVLNTAQNKFKLHFILFLFLLVLLLSPGCVNKNNNDIILATTTSVNDTGLIDVLVERFHKKSGFTVKIIAVGSGQAIKMGKMGQADILLVHSPEDEEEFVKQGYGLDRTTFMYNDFVIVGPENDPAGIRGAKKADEAFKKIADSKVLFISRGDESGTHKKEKTLWEKVKTKPDSEKYIETGQGMESTIILANEKRGYLLSDRATYLSLKKKIALNILCEDEKYLRNYYSVILVNHNKFPKVNARGAKILFEFLLSEDTKNIVENFKKREFGQPLFHYELSIRRN